MSESYAKITFRAFLLVLKGTGLLSKMCSAPALLIRAHDIQIHIQSAITFISLRGIRIIQNGHHVWLVTARN